jgi:hypothetical protein
MGKPNQANLDYSAKAGSKPGEVKHLSSQRKRKRRDSVSSGERTRNSLNLFLISLLVKGEGYRGRTFEFLIRLRLCVVLKIYKKLQIELLAERPWNGRP